MALKDSGIERIEDLKGKTVSIGAPNSGTEVIGLRLMEVAGIDPDKDVTRRAMGVGESTAALREGSIDAFVWSGGLPTGAITDLATTDEIVLLPLDRYVPKLNERYGEAYQESEVEEGEYPGVPTTKTIAVPNLLMVRADMDETLAHDLIAADVRPQEASWPRSTRRPRSSRSRTRRRSSRASSCTRAPSATTRRRRSEARRGRRSRCAARSSPRRARLGAVAHGDDGPRVVVRDRGGDVVAEAALPADGRFALAYRHSVYSAPAEERFRALAGGRFALESVASPSRRVLEYYELEGRITRGRLVPARRGALHDDGPGRDRARPPHARGRRTTRCRSTAGTRGTCGSTVEGT